MSLNQQNQNPPEEQNKGHDPFAALRFRDYRLFTIGRFLLFTGGQMQSVAIGWELYERTNSAMALGGVGLAQVLPIILLTLLSGHVADKYNRQRTTLLTVFLLTVCSLGLALISYAQGEVFLIYACLVVVGLARAFLKPASDAMMWQLIPTKVFGNAATWVSASFQSASVIGPTLGGFAIAFFGNPSHVYILAAIANLLFFICVATIKPSQETLVKEPISVKSLSAGAEFIWNNQIILAAITLDLFAVLFGGAVTLLPVYAKDILKVGAVELGYLQAVPSIGALIMAALLVYLPPIRKAWTTLLWSVFGFGVVTIIFGLSRSVWLSLVMLGLSGALDSISVVIRHTLVQIKTPDHLRGRVAAVNTLFISASNELGGFESGLAAALFGPIVSVVGGGMATIVVVLATMAIWPHRKQWDNLDDLWQTKI